MGNLSYQYKYNDKELQEETGWNDYGWRQYMPEIGRWNGIDQLAEKYLSTSTYAYVANNPVLRFDVDGRWFNEDGTINTSGYTPSYTSGKEYRNSFLGVSGNNGGGGGYTLTGNAAGSMFNYLANGGNINGVSFKNGWAMWSTLDDIDPRMYYDGEIASGDTGGVTLHKARVNTSWDAYKDWTGNSATAMEGMFKFVADQRTALYKKGYWVDNLGELRSVAYAGRAKGSLIGLRSDYLKTTAKFTKYAERAGMVGNIISTGEVTYGVYEDGWKFGKNAQVATAKAVGGIIGAAEGALIGAYIGTTFIPIPGVVTLLGAGVGFVGALVYSEIAGQMVENIQSN